MTKFIEELQARRIHLSEKIEEQIKLGNDGRTHELWKECEKIEELILKLNVNAIPYQCCPKCNGQGLVSKPPEIAGDVHQWSSTSIIFACDVCNGAKIIPMHQILTEAKTDSR